MTATLDGLIATGATFEAIADEAAGLGYHLKERQAKPPKIGAVFIDHQGQIQRVRKRWLGWVMAVDGASRVSVFRWASPYASGMVLEPEVPDPDQPVHWFALTLVVIARGRHGPVVGIDRTDPGCGNLHINYIDPSRTVA